MEAAKDARQLALDYEGSAPVTCEVEEVPLRYLTETSCLSLWAGTSEFFHP